MGVGLLFGFILVCCKLICVNGDEDMNLFFTDIITKFRLISPTIIYHDHLPEICMTHQWMSCLDQENELKILLEENRETDHGKIFYSIKVNILCGPYVSCLIIGLEIRNLLSKIQPCFLF